MSSSFQVDLRAVVDLLSHHLYSSPEVYVRELLQNAVDALTARGRSGTVVVEALGGVSPVVVVEDDGIGLTLEQVHELLSTIGSSSKRDDLLGPRADFLGRFGIGLLSCFLVTDDVVVVTRSVTGGQGVQWTGHADGSYDVRALAEGEGRQQPGTSVYLRARAGMEDLLAPARVLELVRRYGGLLGQQVVVRLPGEEVVVGGGPLPWHQEGVDLLAVGDVLLGERFLDAVPLSLPAAGVSGVAYVLAASPSPGARQRSRVSLKRMLLAEEVDGLLPPWAFFVRAVVDVEALTPVASREALYEDEALEAVRDALGDQLRNWLIALAVGEPRRLQALVRVHSLSLKALAVHDDELLRIFAPWLPVETTLGRMTLSEVLQRSPEVRYTDTVETFQQIAPVASAEGVLVVNAGFTYDAELLERLAVIVPGTTVEVVDGSDVLDGLGEVSDDDRPLAQRLLRVCRPILDPLGCDVEARAFSPSSLPCLYLASDSARFRSSTERTAQAVDGFWGPLLSAAQEGYEDDRPALCLNLRNPSIRRLAEVATTGSESQRTAVEVLYVQALLHGRHPLGRRENALLGRALDRLVQLGADGG